MAQQIHHVIASAVTTVSATTHVDIQNFINKEYGLAQIDFRGASAGTCELQGRLHDALGWVVIATFALADGDDQMCRVTLAPEMRANITAITGGTGIQLEIYT